MLDPRRIVELGYDRIGGRYAELASGAGTRERAKYTEILLDMLPAGSDVLDLGCGAAIPTTRRLGERFRVTGVDISGRQIARARRNVPTAKFIHADMTALDFPPASFDGVAAFYSIVHVPRGEQLGLLQDIAIWMRPGATLVATMGASSTDVGFEEIWLGAPMYWSHYDSKTNRRLVEDAGLRIVSAKEETSRLHGDSETFLWVVAQKPLVTPEDA